MTKTTVVAALTPTQIHIDFELLLDCEPDFVIDYESSENQQFVQRNNCEISSNYANFKKSDKGTKKFIDNTN